MGSRNKLSEDFVAALSEDWSAHGATVIARVRELAPVAYLRVVASLVPQQMAITHGDEFADMTDAQLREELIKSMAKTADEMGMLDVARAVRRHGSKERGLKDNDRVHHSQREQ
jgi:hypothetical protein